jgi:hypothetical protein
LMIRKLLNYSAKCEKNGSNSIERLKRVRLLVSIELSDLAGSQPMVARERKYHTYIPYWFGSESFANPWLNAGPISDKLTRVHITPGRSNLQNPESGLGLSVSFHRKLDDLPGRIVRDGGNCSTVGTALSFPVNCSLAAVCLWYWGVSEERWVQP